MKASTLLRWCLVLEWVFLLGGVAASFFLASFLPSPLATWVEQEDARDPTRGELALFFGLVPLLFCMIVATVGLLCLRRWAAWLYLVTLILGTCMMPFLGPTVQHPVADTLDDVAVILSGMVVALAFFTDSLRKPETRYTPPPLPPDLRPN